MELKFFRDLFASGLAVMIICDNLRLPHEMLLFFYFIGVICGWGKIISDKTCS